MTTAIAAKPLSLRGLKLKLKDTQSSLNDILQFVDGFEDEVSTTELEVRLQKLDELWERFSDILVDIKSHEDFRDDNDAYEKERKQFSDNYYRIKSFLFGKIKDNTGSSVHDQPIRSAESAGQGSSDHVRLPQIRLQMFNGDIDEWLSFRDLYTSLIHWKADLPEVEKFHYLKGCLQGEPKNLIDSLQMTKANYQIAWDTLLKRYNNSKQLKKRQVQSLFKLPCISKESAADLHILLEGFERIVQTLDQLVQPEEYKDLLLMNLLTTRLDPATRRGWEEYSSTLEKDTLKGLSEFLHRRVQVLDSLPSKAVDNKGVYPPQGSTKPKPMVKPSYNTVQSSGGRCVACTGNHPLYQCGTFQRLSVSERDAFLRSHLLCRNCFKMGHLAKDCKCKFSCRNCKGRHHTMVCFKCERDSNSKASEPAKDGISSASKESQASSSSSQVANRVAAEVSVSNTAHQIGSQILLATVVLIVEDDDGNHIPARALLDSGSESNFITERLSQRLKVHRNRVNVSVSGIGQATTKVKQRIQVTIRSRISEFSRELGFLVLPKVTINLPTTSFRVEGWTFPQNVQLADPTFCVSTGVDMILGIEAFFDFFVTGRRISLGDQLSALNESVFGWVVSGGLPTSCQSLDVNCNVSTTEELEGLIGRFWSCEEIEVPNNYSPEEARCEAIYVQTVKRATSGRYTVSLPKKEGYAAKLGESRNIAFRRLLGTERRLARDADLKEKYISFMDQYLQTGHMRKVESSSQDSVMRCYLPHHPVVKEASTTTKVRVVFDASCKTSSGLSLNDVLLTGPVTQEDLRAIIIRSRTKQIMIVADVERMFEQINVFLEDAPLQSILFRSSPADEVATFELTTVSYGTKSAPFLATRTLTQLAMDEEGRFPLAAKATTEDTYMDDVITGSNNIEEAVELRKQLDDMMHSGGFRLRKWASNCTKVLEGITEENLAIQDTNGINLDPDPSIKTLGLTWMPYTDVFRFQFSIPVLESTEELTKRRVLSIIATLFDPLGLIGAVITTAKLFMQLLWTLQRVDGDKLDWDDPLPRTVGESWRKFHLQLPSLNEVRVERCVILSNAVTVELHCFSDASEKAYGGCLYIRSQDPEGKVAVHLLTSKSRVAPLKCQTIPRLELCGALLVAQLYEKVQKSIKFSAPVFFWTDSTCVLRWIQAAPTTWSSFIANRVSKIQNITEQGEWRHVPGVHNPADLISRGILPQDVLHNKMWWHGPNWLVQDRDQWPKTPNNWNTDEGDEEMRRTAVAATTSPRAAFIEWYIEKFSSYSDLVRRTAILLRFMKLLRTPREERTSGFLSTAELRYAEQVLVRLVQGEAFSKEWKALKRGEFVSNQSPLRWYHPKISGDNIIRVGGRLEHSQESDETKHPMVLPARHYFTRLILRYYHERLLHAGPQLLLSVVRFRFWPLRGRDMARQTVHKCQRCFRAKPTPIQQFMGELPAVRVTASRPFAKTGVDYFGPVYLRPIPRRAAVKAYVAIFICMCTKAVHMELVSDLSTERFLQALRRFVARRGRCTDLYSDNGTNFVGARNKLREIHRLLNDKDHQGQVSNFCAEEGMNWHFSPPSAPHFGGLWEAAVRSAKHHLLRVLGDNPTTPEDMNTLLVQVEGCLNSRPITACSEDPSDLEPLTPAHFLVGSSLQSIPEPNLQHIPTNRLKHWELVQRKLQDFWTRWRKEYLSQLQGRVKRWRPPVEVAIGKLVIIQDDKQPPLRWKMGRIQEIHPGADGIVRVLTLKTATGVLTRPVEKICILPSTSDIEEQLPTA